MDLNAYRAMMAHLSCQSSSSDRQAGVTWLNSKTYEFRFPVSIFLTKIPIVSTNHKLSNYNIHIHDNLDPSKNKRSMRAFNGYFFCIFSDRGATRKDVFTLALA